MDAEEVGEAGGCLEFGRLHLGSSLNLGPVLGTREGGTLIERSLNGCRELPLMGLIEFYTRSIGLTASF